MGKTRLSAGCGEAVSKVCGGCPEGCHNGVKRLSGVCGDAIWGVWEDCLEVVGRL